VAKTVTPPLHYLVQLNLNLGIYRQKNIYPAAELDKAIFIALFHLLANFGVVADAFGKRAGYLFVKDLAMTVAGNHTPSFIFSG
jgi:hypothetical protein